MRILLWHGWLLEGSGSNVYTAKIAEACRSRGHDVLLLCQEPEPERFPFVDAWGTVDPQGIEITAQRGGAPAGGRVVLLRPRIGSLLPVFVLDEYPGFRVERFLDLSEEDLVRYLQRNVSALSVAAGEHRPHVVVAGHAVPGGPVARRAVGDGGYVVTIHGSDLEYAVRRQGRYLELAREGLEGARAVAGASREVLDRTVALVPSVAGRVEPVPPGVDVAAFRPLPRRAALEAAAARVEADGEAVRGRPATADRDALAALERRDEQALERLARTYDQSAPDRDTSARLAALAGTAGPVVGFLGKLIPQKGPDLFLQAACLLGQEARALLVGFGLHREWLAALALAVDVGDLGAARWVCDRAGFRLELSAEEVQAGRGVASRVAFTGRLDHRYAPLALAAMDVLVVPSVLDEAFAMVAAEGAASGALPLVARHSGLEEVAGRLEGAAGRPGIFSYDPGSGAPRRMAQGIRRLLSLPPDRRAELRTAASEFVRSEWTWERTAERLLQAAGAGER